MSAWLVTGGAGFIGSNFVRMACRQNGQRIVVLDALTYAGNLMNILDLVDAGRVEFVKGDICDEALVSALFASHRIDCVIHFAAESHVDRSILGPRPFIRTNIEGTGVLLDVARQAWGDGQGRRVFLHVSTDEVFGSLGPHDPPFDESSPYRPGSPYAASKASSDHLARAWAHTFGLPVIISNCSNNYGPYQFPEKLIPLMILNAVDGLPMPVYGDGLQVRDWLHVEDHCRALLRIVEVGRIGATYTIGGSCERVNLQVVRDICAAVDTALGRPLGTSNRLITLVEDRPGHDRRYAIDASLITRELGWRPSHELHTTLPTVIDWYLANRDWTCRVRSGEYRSYYKRQYGQRAAG